jgi:hypothetical protein
MFYLGPSVRLPCPPVTPRATGEVGRIVRASTRSLASRGGARSHIALPLIIHERRRLGLGSPHPDHPRRPVTISQSTECSLCTSNTQTSVSEVTLGLVADLKLAGFYSSPTGSGSFSVGFQQFSLRRFQQSRSKYIVRLN